MQVIYHLGAHCTDNDRVVKCLTRNAAMLGDEGIVVPLPKRYRAFIAETMLKLRHQDVTMDIQDSMMEAVLDSNYATRLILSHEAFLGVPSQAVGNGQFYPMLGDKITRMAKLFGAHEVEFYVGLSNPAVFIPDVFAKAQENDLETFLNDSDPMLLRWSEMLARLRQAAPNSKITVWANEDTPLIWPRVINAVSGHQNDTPLQGINDFYGALMSEGGLKRMTGYLETHPPKNDAHYQRVVGAFLDKFGLEDVIETEVDLPSWSESYVHSLSDLYDQDLEVIAGMAGIEFLAP